LRFVASAPRGSLGDNRAVVDNGDAVGHAFRLIHVVGGEKDGSLFSFVQVLHMIPEQIPALWVKPERRFIEEEDSRVCSRPRAISRRRFMPPEKLFT